MNFEWISVSGFNSIKMDELSRIEQLWPLHAGPQATDTDTELLLEDRLHLQEPLIAR